MYGCGESVAQQVIYSDVFGFFSRWRCCLGLLAWGRLLWLMSLQSMLGTTWWKSMPGEKLQRMMTISPNASFLLWTLVLLPVLWQWRSQRGRVPETHRHGNSNEVGFRIQREAELPHHWRNRRSSFGTFKSQKLNESSIKITTTTTFYEINIHFSKSFLFCLLLFWQAAINILLATLNRKDGHGGEAGAETAKKKKKKESILLRPIICICNDL